MPELTQQELTSMLSGDPDEIDVHLQLIEHNIKIEGKSVNVHCHCMTVDGNGKVNPERLAEFMSYALADYAIPKTQLVKARERDLKFNSTSSVAALHKQAINTFTDLEKTGEGGEMLLFLLAERFLKLPQVLCKMDLKTDSRMHYHGADGVYASVTDEGLLKLFWGESKVYNDASTAIRDCLSSLAPFLIEPDHSGSERERDLMLLSDKADLGDPTLTAAFKKYFDRTSPMSNRVEYCGVAMVAFDADFYGEGNVKLIAEDVVNGARDGLKAYIKQLTNRLTIEKLDHIHIEFFCVPIPCADGFRTAFLKALGLK